MDQSDDRTILDRLVAEQLPAALRFAMRLTGNADMAEEVVQEALFRAARGWRTFRGEAQFRTWLFRIVIHAFRDHLARVRPAQQALTDDVCDVRQQEPVSAALTDELGELIAQRIAELPPRQREVLVLTTYEGLTPPEIASALDITEANVHSTLHAARTKLRRQLAGYLAEK